MFGCCNHQFPFDFSSFLNPCMLSCKLLSFGTHFTWKCTLIIKELEILSINGFDITWRISCFFFIVDFVILFFDQLSIDLSSSLFLRSFFANTLHPTPNGKRLPHHSLQASLIQVRLLVFLFGLRRRTCSSNLLAVIVGVAEKRLLSRRLPWGCVWIRGSWRGGAEGEKQLQLLAFLSFFLLS